MDEERLSSLEVNPICGSLIYFSASWEKISKNRYILESISGYKIPFIKKPKATFNLYQKLFSIKENRMLSLTVKEFLSSGAISKCKYKKGQFLSPYFLIKKPNGSMRFILNLKKLNEFVFSPHFKLEDYKVVKNLISKDCFMSTLDLKDAYFSIPICKKHRKFLRFKFDGSLYEFNCLPFGLCSAPYIFTKIMKPILEHLRSKGIILITYLDDFLILGDSEEACQRYVNYTKIFLRSLGFRINEEKCSRVPSNRCKFLGFVFNSIEMTMSIPDSKKVVISTNILKLIKKKSISIRQFAKTIGFLVSICPTVKYGWLYLRRLERQKYLELNNNKGYYDAKILLSESSIKDLRWWLRAINVARISLNSPKFSMTIFTDASDTGWGAVCEGVKIHGFWNINESKDHINFRELLAAFFGLKAFCKNMSHLNVLLKIDNTTAIAYINRMGSIKFKNLSDLTRKIWQWCEKRDIWIFATYIESKSNVEADKESRSLAIDTEYSLNKTNFSLIINEFGTPEIDLFASINNHKCARYVSWKKDPNSIAVDAFSIDWSKHFFYAFPPFSLISKCLQKIKSDRAKGILVVPVWRTQPWFPLFVKMSCSNILIFKPNKDLLLSPFSESHPLWTNLSLATAILSGKPTQGKG